MIHVALLEGDVSSLELEAGLRRLLHPRELASMSPRAIPKRQGDFLRGRVVAHRLLSKVAGGEPSGYAVVADEEGVPWAYGGETRLSLSISISHTAGTAGAATVDLPWRVGIDVEHPIASARALIGDYFERVEMDLCDRLKGEALAWRAAEIWALKEAGLKCLGTGLKVPTSAVVVRSIGPQADSLGWQSVDMDLGPTAPDPAQPLRGWMARTESVVVALALLGSEPGDPPRPARAVSWSGATAKQDE